MGENKQRRIFRGYYKSFDGAVVHVLLIVKDVDTGESIVLFIYDDWDNRNNHGNYCMTVQSFCESVEYHGKTVPKFTRMTQHPAERNDDTYMGVQGFNIPRKHIKKSQKNVIRICRSASNYEAYA